MLNFNKWQQPPLFVREYWRKVFWPKLNKDDAVGYAIPACTAWLEKNNTHDVEISEDMSCRGSLIGSEVRVWLAARGGGGYHYYTFAVKFPFFAFQEVKVRLIDHHT